MNLEKLYNANFVERVTIDDQQNGYKRDFLIFAKSGDNLTAEELEHSMSEWKVQALDTSGVGIATDGNAKFDNCHAAHNNYGGEYRHGKGNAIYGLIFVFELATLNYIGQGYILKVTNADKEESLIFEGVQTGDQRRDLTMAKVILEAITGGAWKMAKRSCREELDHGTWMGAENGSNYVFPSKYNDYGIKLIAPNHRQEMLEEFCDISDVDYDRYYGSRTISRGVHIYCEDCGDEDIQEDSIIWRHDCDWICSSCMQDRAEDDIPVGTHLEDWETYAEEEMNAESYDEHGVNDYFA